jgi:hypothetical protein
VRTQPSEREIALCAGLSRLLAEYHGDEPGNFACHMQAVKLLTGEGGPLRDLQPSDFLEIRRFGPPDAEKPANPGGLAGST